MGIVKYFNFLSEEDYKKVLDKSIEIFFDRTSTFRVNYSYWDKKLIENSGPILTQEIEKGSEVYNIMKNSVKDLSEGEMEICNFYYFMEGSSIGWHNDGQWKNAATYYLNPEWRKESGGIYLYELEEGEYSGFLPKANMLALQTPGTKHHVTKIYGDVRATVQMFFK